MTQEEKAKAYDEALKYARIYYTNGNEDMKMMMKTCFPVLVEEKDEKSKKWILEYLYDGLRRSDEQFKGQFRTAIAWLEKQGKQPICKTPSREIILAIWDLGNEWKELTKGSISTEYGTQLDYIQKHWQESEYYLRAKQSEQKPYGQRAECLDCQFNYAGECKGFCSIKKSKQKPADKVEPKFHEGDWIIHYGTKNIYKVVAIIDNQYQLKYGDTYTIQQCTYVDRHTRLWDITKDAKDGDILQLGKVTAIFQKYIGNGNCKCYCSLYNGKFEIPSQDGDDNSYGCYDAIPATKEQRDTLLKAMVDAGYKWDRKGI